MVQLEKFGREEVRDDADALKRLQEFLSQEFGFSLADNLAALRRDAETIPNTIPEGDLEVCYHHSQGSVGLMIRLLYTTGVRIQELLDIEKTDIDADKLRIRIHGKGQRDRYVFTCPDVMQELVEYCEGRYGQPFAGIDQFAVRRAIYFELKKYSNAKQLSPHAIRHTFATKAAAQGCNATTLQVMLGHKQLKTTQKYIDLGRHDAQQAFQTYATVH